MSNTTLQDGLFLPQTATFKALAAVIGVRGYKMIQLYRSVSIYRRRKSPRVGCSRRNLHMKFAVPGIFTNGSARHVRLPFTSVKYIITQSMELKDKQDWKSVIDNTDTFLFDCDGEN